MFFFFGSSWWVLVLQCLYPITYLLFRYRSTCLWWWLISSIQFHSRHLTYAIHAPTVTTVTVDVPIANSMVASYGPTETLAVQSRTSGWNTLRERDAQCLWTFLFPPIRFQDRIKRVSSLLSVAWKSLISLWVNVDRGQHHFTCDLFTQFSSRFPWTKHKTQKEPSVAQILQQVITGFSAFIPHNAFYLLYQDQTLSCF